MKDIYKLRLYIAGSTPKSINAIHYVKAYCEEYLPGKHTLEIIDLTLHPYLAEEHQIFALPALVKVLPEPLKKFIGDFSNIRNKFLMLNAVA